MELLARPSSNSFSMRAHTPYQHACLCDVRPAHSDHHSHHLHQRELVIGLRIFYPPKLTIAKTNTVIDAPDAQDSPIDTFKREDL